MWKLVTISKAEPSLKVPQIILRTAIFGHKLTDQLYKRSVYISVRRRIL